MLVCQTLSLFFALYFTLQIGFAALVYIATTIAKENRSINLTFQSWASCLFWSLFYYLGRK